MPNRVFKFLVILGLVITPWCPGRATAAAPRNVVIMPGGKPTMFFAVLMFGEPGAEILYPNPGFPIYESVIRYSGATPVPVRLDEAPAVRFPI